MIKVIDNFLANTDYQMLKNLVYRQYDFGWRYTGVCNLKLQPKEEVCEDKFNFQFVHILYNQNIPHSEYWSTILNPFMHQLNMKSLIQAKINFTPVTHEIVEHCFHIDTEDNTYKSSTAVYYLNTCDGYTKFETGEKVESVANRIVVFPATTRHTGTTCTNEQGRYVLNINYF